MPDSSPYSEPAPSRRAPSRVPVDARAGFRHGVVVVEGTFDWIEGDRVHFTAPLDAEVDELVELRLRIPGRKLRIAMRLHVEAREERVELDLPVTARIVEFAEEHRAALMEWLVPPPDPEIEVDPAFTRVRARWRTREALERDWARSLGCAGLTVPWHGQSPEATHPVSVELRLPNGELIVGPAQVVLELPGQVALALKLDRPRMEALRAGAFGSAG